MIKTIKKYYCDNCESEIDLGEEYLSIDNTNGFSISTEKRHATEKEGLAPRLEILVYKNIYRPKLLFCTHSCFGMFFETLIQEAKENDE